MSNQKFTVTAKGTDRLDVLNRISTLYIQKRIPVESIDYHHDGSGQCTCRIVCFSEHEALMRRIAAQIDNIIEITSVELQNV